MQIHVYLVAAALIGAATANALRVAFDTDDFKHHGLAELEDQLEEAKVVTDALKQNIRLEKDANMAVRKVMRQIPEEEFTMILNENGEGWNTYWRGVLETINGRE